RVVKRHLLFICVEIVLRLLRHGEGPGHRHLDHAVGVLAQEFDVADLDRILRRTLPVTRGTGLGWLERSNAVPGLSMSTPLERIERPVLRIQAKGADLLALGPGRWHAEVPGRRAAAE